ncbi:unnamed protein product [Mytilus edulis]|uniref:DUF5641 domain-containing protein n=1 Tax=Mytilus edulis TaxID=6550 RepID=A0A8S3VQX2_MYTED|nr:unnamed protein product [Mytilus edulis]
MKFVTSRHQSFFTLSGVKKLRPVVTMATYRELKQHEQIDFTQIKSSRSVSNHSHLSSKSDILRKKAQLETKVKYSAKQASIIRQKAALEAELSILQIKEETEVLESEIRILENESMVGEDDDLDSVSEFQKERTKEYVQNLHIPDTKPIAIVNTPEKQSPQLSAYANTSTPYVPPNVNNNNSQMELCNLITKMMARKDIVLSRLIKYNDSPFQFLSWKETFKDVMKELSEKWSTEAIKYKKRHNMLYPPFSFFVDFTYDMAKWRTDPSFQFAPQTNKTSNPASIQSNLRVSTRKTDVYTIDEKQVCPIHGTNHDLNECRAFRQKPMTERMDLLQKNRLCFRCCSLKKHLQRSCRENIHCNICKSSNHPTALHIYQQDQNIDPYNGSQSVNDCENLPSSVYLQGPTFLSQDSDIGKQMYPLVDPNDDKEVRPSVVTNKTDINEEVGLSSRFSRLASWKSLVRAIQFLKAFIRKLHQESPPSRQEVEQFIIKTVQAEAFSNDINAISSVGQLLPTSNLLSLSPVLDKHNILRKGQDEQTMLQFGTKDMLRSQWKMVQGLADEFWSKWNKEYLHTLQVRKKWELPIKDLNIGDIVLMRDKELPRPQWPMAIVTKVFPVPT